MVAMDETQIRVLVVGAGLTGAEIAVEYALGGATVDVLARSPAAVSARFTAILDDVETLGLRAPETAAAARTRLRPSDRLPSGAIDLILESLPEDGALKAEVMAPIAAAHPDATIATNTSSLSVAALGRAYGAAERTLGTHYLNPPLLMDPVELIPAAADAARVDAVERILTALGKTPVRVADVPGFILNRLQYALLREAVALVNDGVATAEGIDQLMRAGLGLRWAQMGPFETAAAGGIDTFERIAQELYTQLSNTTDPAGLRAAVDSREAAAAALVEARNRALVRAMRSSGSTSPAPPPRP